MRTYTLSHPLPLPPTHTNTLSLFLPLISLSFLLFLCIGWVDLLARTAGNLKVSAGLKLFNLLSLSFALSHTPSPTHTHTPSHTHVRSTQVFAPILVIPISSESRSIVRPNRLQLLNAFLTLFKSPAKIFPKQLVPNFWPPIVEASFRQLVATQSWRHFNTNWSIVAAGARNRLKLDNNIFTINRDWLLNKRWYFIKTTPAVTLRYIKDVNFMLFAFTISINVRDVLVREN